MNDKIKMLNDMINSKDIDTNDLYIIRDYLMGLTSPKGIYRVNNTTLYNVLNKVLNNSYDMDRYFIELPNNKNFDTKYDKAIIKANLIDAGSDRYKIVSPRVGKINTFTTKDFKEVTGIKDMKLYDSDYYRIIAKYPYIIGRMLSFGFANKKKITHELGKLINTTTKKENENYKEGPFEHIKSIREIEFVKPKEIITYEDIINKEVDEKVKKIMM